ncbi:methyl-accepting chemotaxis protein [Kaistia defluvii]|uniref:methyl-accepting chemotaxis protein n=1 Tax=Kaistia defluvii TaxID=410841 RepID=UPI00225C0411|nr:methyl-accepting chemotaxis protein [Kaistia defluvii]MCX5521200.1 methyl-accepting chemotaxis protein [Kaistia defluvii]
MKNLTIRQRIIGSFAAVLAVMSIMAGLAFVSLVRAETEATAIETNTMPGLFYSLRMRAGWFEAQALVQDLALSDTDAGRDAAVVAINANEEKLRGFMTSYEGSIDSTEDRDNLDTVKRLSEIVFAKRSDLVAMTRGGLSDDTLARQRSSIKTDVEPAIVAVQDALRKMVDYNKNKSDFATQTILANAHAGKLILIVSFAFTLALSLLLGYWLFRAVMGPLGKLVAAVEVMRRGDFSQRATLNQRDEFSTLADGFNGMADDLTGLIGQVQKSGIQVNTSITEVAATSKQQQATANEIATTTTEIGATAKEISATSNELVRTMNEVSTVAEQTAGLANGGQAGLQRMEATMRHVMEAAGAINAKLAILSEKAGNINQVVTTITKVADQTNLLSLNAAIEAEKAGQYGRGFAVVATEIRRLADQTAVSTYDIEQMVKDIQSAVAAGVMGMDKFSEEVRRGMTEVQQVGGQLSDIIEQVQGLVPRFEIANEGMQAQATGAGQISDALSQLSEAAQQTVESLQQSSIAIDELNQVSSGLRNSITRFKLRA